MGIKIEDLTVTFRNHVTAVNHADLEIPKGMFGLLGENGAGKTTLMRVLTTNQWYGNFRRNTLQREKF